MSTIEIDGGKYSPFEFRLNIKGAAEGVTHARLSLISEKTILSFPCIVEKEQESTRLDAVVYGATREFDRYKLEVFIQERYFVPLEGAVIVKESIKVEAVAPPSSPKVEVMSSAPMTVTPLPVKKVQSVVESPKFDLPPRERRAEPSRFRGESRGSGYTEADALIDAAIKGGK